MRIALSMKTFLTIVCRAAIRTAESSKQQQSLCETIANDNDNDSDNDKDNKDDSDEEDVDDSKRFRFCCCVAFAVVVVAVVGALCARHTKH